MHPFRLIGLQSQAIPDHMCIIFSSHATPNYVALDDGMTDNWKAFGTIVRTFIYLKEHHFYGGTE